MYTIPSSSAYAAARDCDSERRVRCSHGGNGQRAHAPGRRGPPWRAAVRRSSPRWSRSRRSGRRSTSSSGRCARRARAPAGRCCERGSQPGALRVIGSEAGTRGRRKSQRSRGQDAAAHAGFQSGSKRMSRLAPILTTHGMGAHFGRLHQTASRRPHARLVCSGPARGHRLIPQPPALEERRGNH